MYLLYNGSASKLNVKIMIYLIYKYSLIVHGLCSLILCGLLLLLTTILSPVGSSIEKYAAYECGFKTFELLQIPFDIHFYKIGILFLIFDVEILFLLP
jgi:NADH:ubiquinone oxidoreductase subunit 3 (subunit A)